MATVPLPDRVIFGSFADRAVAVLEAVGLTKNGGKKAAGRVILIGSRSDWRGEIEKLARGEQGGLLELARRADLRTIYGDAPLAEEIDTTLSGACSNFSMQSSGKRPKVVAMAARTRSAFSFPLPALRGVAKGLAEMPTGLDFFSRLRLERSGRHRGQFGLAQFAVDPLITNVRMMAISCGVHETSTIGRIKALQERGRLSVELTERLLQAYHDFIRLKIGRQLAQGCEKESQAFLDPQDLSEDDCIPAQERARGGHRP